jgi:hypothetical protein
MWISGIAFSQFLDNRFEEPIVSGQRHVPLVKRLVDLLNQVFRQTNGDRDAR